MPIDNDRRVREPVDFQRTSGASPWGATPQPPVRPSPEGAQRAVEALPDPPAYAEFLRNLGGGTVATGARTASNEGVAVAAARDFKADIEAQKQLNKFCERFSGPYVVDGKSVQARPMFRMNGGFNEPKARAREGALYALCKKAGCDLAVGAAHCGRPTPEQLVKVTQALIHAGKLAPGGDDSLELRIRQMQWEWGVGVDCAGYTEGAAGAVGGNPKVQPSTNDVFSKLASSKRKVPVAETRPGDVIHLNPPPKGSDRVGHNVVVYESKLADAATRAQLAARSPDAAEFLREPGPFQVLSVDSSWGAGEGDDFGGFRRDTWVYDTSSERWGYFDSRSGSFGSSKIGPHEEPYVGAFRGKVTP